jgi:hypothetical protein
MTVLHDLTGRRFARLVVVERATNNARGRARWVCACECMGGNRTVVLGANLLAGITRSCGCLRLEALTAANRLRRRPA